MACLKKVLTFCGNSELTGIDTIGLHMWRFLRYLQSVDVCFQKLINIFKLFLLERFLNVIA